MEARILTSDWAGFLPGSNQLLNYPLIALSTGQTGGGLSWRWMSIPQYRQSRVYGGESVREDLWSASSPCRPDGCPTLCPPLIGCFNFCPQLLIMNSSSPRPSWGRDTIGPQLWRSAHFINSVIENVRCDCSSVAGALSMSTWDLTAELRASNGSLDES